MTDMAVSRGAPAHERDRDSKVRRRDDVGVRTTTETKTFFKTSEFFVWALAVAGTLLACYAEDDSFTAQDGWLFVAILSAAYMLSRGLAKAGSNEPTKERREYEYSS
jgi:hypothetical protein